MLGKIASPESNPQIPDSEPRIHTARVGDQLYDIMKLREFAESLPTHTSPIEQFEGYVAEGNLYWEDAQGSPIGPHQILQDWEAAQKNPLWEEHVQKIKHVQTSTPVWILEDGTFVDGMHRLTKSFIEKKSVVPYKIVDSILAQGIIEQNG